MPGQKIAEPARRTQILDAAEHVATQYGIEGLTVRRVASAAGLSHGLVHFHFKTKEALLEALLDRLLAATATVPLDADECAFATPLDRLHALLRREMARLTRDRGRIRLFFDFWLLGMRHPVVRAKMRAELARYRDTFRCVAAEVVSADSERLAGVTPEALASMAVAFVKGCAVQSVIDPRGFDVGQVAKAADMLLGVSGREPSE